MHLQLKMNLHFEYGFLRKYSRLLLLFKFKNLFLSVLSKRKFNKKHSKQPLTVEYTHVK